MKSEKIKKFFTILVLICSIGTLMFSTYKIILWYKDNRKISSITEAIIESTKVEELLPSDKAENVNPPEDKFDPYWDYIKMSLISVDFKNLLEQNSDTTGWVKVEGTSINYPVVQGKNNEYYLNHSFTKEYNSAGWVYLDYRNSKDLSDQNTIIYGHSRVDGSIFHSLRNVLKENWYKNKNYHIVKYSTPTENTLWQVFSVYTVKEESYYITPGFETNDEFKSWIDTMKKRSKFDFNTNVTTDDKILTLSSCYDTNGTRMVLHAKLIKKEAR